MKTHLNRIISILLVLTMLVGIAPLSFTIGADTSLNKIFGLSADAASTDYSGITPNQYMSKVLLYHNYNGVYGSKGLSIYSDLINYEERVKACIKTRNDVQSNLRTLDLLYNTLTLQPSNISDQMLGKWEIYAGIIIDLIGKQMSDHTLMDSVNCAENKFIIKATKQLMGAAKDSYEINEIMKLGYNAKLTNSQKNAIKQVLNNNNDYQNLKIGGDVLKGISDGINYATTLMDTITLVASIKSIGEISEALSDTLDKMYANTSNPDLKYAINKVKTCLAQNSFKGMLKIGASKLIKQAVGSILDAAWDIVVESAVGGPIGTAIAVGQALGTAVSKFCFSTDAAKDKLIVCYAMEDVDKAIVGAVKAFASAYRSNDSISNADNFMTALQLLTKAYPLHCDYCADFWYTAYSKGALSWLFKNRNQALSARNAALNYKNAVGQWKQFVYLEGALKNGYEKDAPEEYNNYFKSLSENGLGQITKEQLDAVREDYGYETGKYWTYKSGGSATSSYKATNRAGRKYSYKYNGIECYGFANFVMSKVTGTNVYPGNGNKNGWVKLSPSEVTELRIGDIVRIGKNDSNGHSGIVYTNSNGKCTFLQCLGGVDNKITVGNALAGTKALNNGYKKYSTLAAMKSDNALVYVYRYQGSISGVTTSGGSVSGTSTSYSAGTYKVNAKAGLNARQSPTTNSAITGGYSYGTVVTVSSINGKWGKTSKGWIYLPYTVKTSESPSTPATNTYYDSSARFETGTYIVTAKEGLRIRQSATAASARLGAYKYNTAVDVLATNGNWGQTDQGWICLDYTRFVAPLKGETFQIVNYDIGIYKATDASGLNYRTEPNQNSQKLGAIQKNTEFEVVTVDGSWGYCNELGGWLCLNYAEYVSALPVRLPVPAAPALTSSTSSELPVGDIITVDWAGCDYADSYKAMLIDASTDQILETKEGITNTSVSFVAPYAGTFNVNVVSVNAQHESPVANMNGFEAKAPVTVTFKDWNGAVLSQQTIKYGADAVAPVDPTRTGYTFTGWNGVYSVVRSDIDVTANYTKNTYTVTFYDYDGTTVIDTQQVLFEDGATAPVYSAPTGYTFVNWDKDFSNITEDTDVKAVIQWTSKYPLEISTSSSIYRNNTNYITTAIVNNSPNTVTDAKVIVSLKTTEGKELAEVFSDNLSLAAGEVKTLTLTAQYDGAATVGNIFVVKANDENIPLAKNIVVSVDPGTSWSLWSTNVPPADAVQTESRTEYRYRTKDYKSGNNSSMEGYTLYNTTINQSAWSGWSAWQDAYVDNAWQDGYQIRDVKTQSVADTNNINWGSWSGWQDAPISSSALCQVETRQVEDTNNPIYETRYSYKTVYHYYYYTKTNSETNGNTSYYKNSNYPYGPWYVTFDSELPTTTGGTSVPVTKYKWSNHHNTGKYMYVYASDPYTTQEVASSWQEIVGYNQKTQYRCRTGSYGTKTQYSYRTCSLTYTYYFWKWLDWSNWSTDPQTANDNKEVQTRATYRYVSNTAANIEDTSGISRTISGRVDSAYNGNNAILHICSADGTTQYVGQTIIGNEGSYNYTFKLKNEPTAKSGDYFVALSIEGTTAAIALEPILAPVPVYTVTFKDADGSIIETQQIEKGQNAVMPDAPVVVGYIFTGWDNNGSNIQGDTIITATYEKKRFDVVFVDELNETTETKTFEYGDELIVPEIANISDAYQFLGWDAIIDGRTTVEDNMVVNAVYEKKVFTINFYGYNGAVFATYNVEYGDGLVAPQLEEDGTHCFIAWDTEADFNYITNDLDVYPAYDFEETVEEPTASIVTGTYDTTQTITLSCATEGAKIYYTTDGTDPLAEASSSGASHVSAKKVPAKTASAYAGTLYTGPFTLDSSAELTFVAVKDGMNSSFYETAVYSINTDVTEDIKHLVTVHYGLYDMEYSILVNDGELADIFGEEETEAGYTLKGVYTNEAHSEAWNLETDSVTESIDLYLVWEENMYTVTFVDSDENEIDKQTVAFLDSAIAPTVPEIEGYTFTGWDVDYSNVSEDLTVRATYIENDSITGITLSDSSIVLQNGVSTAKLEATVILSSGTTNDHVIWQSDDETIVAVDDNGNLTAISEGKTTVYAVAEDSGMSAECEVIYAVGCAHNRTREVEGYAASCTETGKTSGLICLDCGSVLANQEAIPAIGHAYGTWALVKAPTCTEAGLEQRVCANDSNHIETRSVTKLAHDDRDGDGYCDSCNADLSSGGETQESNCVCGKYHTGPFAGFIKFFHKIVYFFKNLFGKN